MTRLQKSLLLVVALIATAAPGTGCKCSTKKTPADGRAKTTAAEPAWKDLLEMLPGGIDWGLFAGDGASLLRGTQGLLRRLRGTTIGIMAEEMVRMLHHKLGLRRFDPYDAAAWRAQGVDLTRGATMVADGRFRWHFLFGVSRRQAATALVQSALRQLAGASRFRKFGEGTLALNTQGKPVAAYAFHRGYAVVCGPVAGENDAAALLARVTSPTAPRLVQQPVYQTLKRRIRFGQGLNLLVLPDALRHVDKELAAMLGAFRGLALAIQPSAGGAEVDGFILTSRNYARAVQRMVLPGPPTPGLAQLLTPDTVLALAGRLDFRALFDMVLGTLPDLRKLTRAVFQRLSKKLDVDVGKELLANLTGDGALAIHKLDAAAVPLALGGGSPAELLATDPFHLTLLLRVRNAELARKFLLKVAILSEARTEKIGKIEVFPLPLLRMFGPRTPLPPGSAALRFALAADTLVVTMGKGRMARALKALRSGQGGFFLRVLDRATRERLRKTRSDPVLYLSGPTLVENLKEIEAALLKQKKLLFSSLVQKATELAERIQDLSGEGSARRNGLRIRLRLRLK